MVGGEAEAEMQRLLQMARSITGSALKLVIMQAINSPRLFVFGELLDLEGVQALAGTPSEDHLRLLNIFAHGTFSDYACSADELPALSDKAKRKLMLLSIVSLAQKNKVVPYSDLEEMLQSTNLRAIEDLVLECNDKELLKAKLDQRNRQMRVEWTFGRDVQDMDVMQMLSTLNRWHHNCEQTLSLLDKEMDRARDAKAQRKKEVEAHKSHVAAVKAQAEENKASGIDIGAQHALLTATSHEYQQSVDDDEVVMDMGE